MTPLVAAILKMERKSKFYMVFLMAPHILIPLLVEMSTELAVTYNPFNDNKHVWWLSDYPHTIKLRNFIVNHDGQLQVQEKR